MLFEFIVTRVLVIGYWGRFVWWRVQLYQLAMYIVFYRWGFLL